MKNIKFEIVEEVLKNQKYYALIRVFAARKTVYCAIVQDDEISVKTLGNDLIVSKQIYELLRDGEVSAIHLSDVVNDLENEIFA